MRETLGRIDVDGGIHNVEKDIVSVDEIFALQGIARVKWDEGCFLR